MSFAVHFTFRVVKSVQIVCFLNYRCEFSLKHEAAVIKLGLSVMRKLIFLYLPQRRDTERAHASHINPGLEAATAENLLAAGDGFRILR